MSSQSSTIASAAVDASEWNNGVAASDTHAEISFASLSICWPTELQSISPLMLLVEKLVVFWDSSGLDSSVDFNEELELLGLRPPPMTENDEACSATSHKKATAHVASFVMVLMFSLNSAQSQIRDLSKHFGSRLNFGATTNLTVRMRRVSRFSIKAGTVGYEGYVATTLSLERSSIEFSREDE